MGAVPRHCWPGPDAGFGGLGGPSPVLAEGPVGAVPRHSWLGPAAGFGAVVPRHSWRRALWVLFPGISKLAFPVTTLKTTHQIEIQGWVSSEVVN